MNVGFIFMEKQQNEQFIIGIGIFIFILEICMAEQNISADRELFEDAEDNEFSLAARHLRKYSVFLLSRTKSILCL